MLDIVVFGVLDIVVCILTRPTGSSKYGTTRKNTQRYYTAKRPIRYIYLSFYNFIYYVILSYVLYK